MKPQSQRKPIPSAPPAGQAPQRTLNRLTLAKLGHHYIYTYEPGRELDVLSHVVSQVQNSTGLDWYDAAVLAHQMGQHMTEHLERMAAQPGTGFTPEISDDEITGGSGPKKTES